MWKLNYYVFNVFIYGFKEEKIYLKDIYEWGILVIILFLENGWEGLGGYIDKVYFIYWEKEGF